MLTKNDYLKLSKERLVELLVERDKLDEERLKDKYPFTYVTYSGFPVTYGHLAMLQTASARIRIWIA